MQPVREQLEKLVQRAVHSAFPELTPEQAAVTIEVPAKSTHGDYATSLPLRLASVLRQAPLAIAEKIAAAMPASSMIGEVTTAAPGFVNIRLSAKWLNKLPEEILAQGEHYGDVDVGKGQRVLVEFISANPTGPLHVGTGRGAFTGDVLSNVLDKANYEVTREYYLNDIGKQVATLAESVTRRYFQQQGIPMDYPENFYQGDYVIELAKKLKLDSMRMANMLEVRDRIQARVLRMMITDIKRLVEKKLKIKMDSWFSEQSLYSKKITDQVFHHLQEQGLTYEKDDATWLRTTAHGDDKDRVLKKADGDQTYFLSDVAMLWYRFNVQKFDEVTIILGADHHGYIKRFQAAAQMIGVDPARLKLPIVQLVRFIENGVEVKMSKRKGTFVELEELINEVGLDAARFFFLMHAADTHMDFDLALAKEQSQKNPVYYVQYAHARISGILRNVAQVSRRRSAKHISEPLAHPAELALLRQLLRFPELVTDAARSGSLQKLPFAAMELATTFHEFYDQVRVIDGETVADRRATLVAATAQVLRQLLGLMGVSSPKHMAQRMDHHTEQ
jgi:arginyl-tRNA synthetase